MKPRIAEALNSYLGFNILLPDYVIMISMAFIIGTYLTVKAAEKENIPPNFALNAILLAIIFSIVGSRVYFIFLNFDYYTANPLEIVMLWKGGLASYGGFIGGFIAAALYLKSKSVSVLKFWDCGAVAIALGVILTKIGCFMNGCDYGQISSVPWSVRYPHESGVYRTQLLQGRIDISNELSLPVHPTQIYDSLSGVLLLLAVLWLQRRKKFDGQLSLTLVILYSLLRFITEFTRGDHLHNILNVFSLPQIFAIFTGLLASIFLIQKFYQNYGNPKLQRYQIHSV